MNGPIFIVGTQRSGTTLLYRMLGAHPDVFLVNEIWEFYKFADRRVNDDHALSEFLIERVGLSHPYLPCAGAEPNDPFGHLDLAFAAKLRTNGKSRWGIKDPRLTYYLEPFERRFPDGRFVFIVRDVRAVTNSYLARRMNVANVFHGAKLWVEQTRIQKEFTARHPDRARMVSFEDLVDDSESILKEICEFLDVPFEASMLEYHRETPTTKVHAGNENITKPVQKSIADKWRGELSPKQIAVIESVAADSMKAHGYQPTGPSVSIGRLRKVAYDLHQWLMTTYWWQKRSNWPVIRRPLTRRTGASK